MQNNNNSEFIEHVMYWELFWVNLNIVSNWILTPTWRWMPFSYTFLYGGTDMQRDFASDQNQTGKQKWNQSLSPGIKDPVS